ncbi:MAG: hypothetical protein LBK06_07140 [Planctomycetaceae bacterium]|nr:hypothetical protein [Planctomycetaceae bacterium]
MCLCGKYAEAVLKFAKLNTATQQREAVVQGRSLLPYRLRYIHSSFPFVFSVFNIFGDFNAKRCEIRFSRIFVFFAYFHVLSFPYNRKNCFKRL